MSDIKSNNPHLTGGEKTSCFVSMLVFGGVNNRLVESSSLCVFFALPFLFPVSPGEHVTMND